MRFFKDVISHLLRTAEEAFSGHSEFKIADPTAIGQNPVRSITLDAVPLDGEQVMVTLSWQGGEKIFEKTMSSEEASHKFQLIQTDLSQIVALTSEEKYDEAKAAMKEVMKTYTEDTDAPVATNLPKLVTTQAEKDIDENLWKQAAQVKMQNVFPSGTVQNLVFESNEDLKSYQDSMKAAQPSKEVPLWEQEGSNKAPEAKDDLVLPSMSYEDLEQEKEKETKNLDKRIKDQVKTELESALEEKKATMFTEKDKEFVDGMKAVGRTWDEIKRYMVKELAYDKESVDMYIDDLRNKEEGVEPVKEEVSPLRPPEELVSPETHEKLLKDLEDKKEKPVEEIKEIEKVDEPIIEESAKKGICPECDGEGSVPAVRGGRVVAEDCPSCGGDKHLTHEPSKLESSQEEIARADNSEIRKVAVHSSLREKIASYMGISEDEIIIKQAANDLNPLQEPIKEEPTMETPKEDVIPFGKSEDHLAPSAGDWVMVKSDLKDELPAFKAKFVSEYTSNNGTKYATVETEAQDLLEVEMHRVTKITDAKPSSQETDPIAEPIIEKPIEEPINTIPSSEKLTSLTSELKKRAFDFRINQDLKIGDKVKVIGQEGTIYKVDRVHDVYSNEEEFNAYQEIYGNLGLSWEGNEIITVMVDLDGAGYEAFVYQVEKLPLVESSQDDLLIIKAEAEQLLKTAEIWNLETLDEEAWSQTLSEFATRAMAGDVDEQNYLRTIWDNEPWESIKKKLEAEGSTWYVWWMDGVHNLMRSDSEKEGKISFKFIKKGLEKHAGDSAFEANGWTRVWVDEIEIESDSKYPEILKLPDENARVAALKELAKEIAYDTLHTKTSAGGDIAQMWFESLKPSDHDRIDWVALANPQVAESSLKQEVIGSEHNHDPKVIEYMYDCPKCVSEGKGKKASDFEKGISQNKTAIAGQCNNCGKQLGEGEEEFCAPCREELKDDLPVNKTADDTIKLCPRCGQKSTFLNDTQEGAHRYRCDVCNRFFTTNPAYEKKAADEPAVEPKILYKDLKKAPAGVEREKAVPASPELDVVLAKMDVLEQNLATLDNAKKQIQAKMKEEIAKLEQSGERVQMEKELQESINKAGVLIDALENKVVAWRDKIYTMQTQEVSYVPNITPKEMLEKIYAKFNDAQQFVESVLNGMKSQAVNVLEKTLVKFPGKKSSLNKEANVIDVWNDELLAALKELSSPL